MDGYNAAEVKNNASIAPTNLEFSSSSKLPKIQTDIFTTTIGRLIDKEKSMIFIESKDDINSGLNR